ncbi:hypothetical protein PGTUg99_037321 [Puccinia graminis f. sp. tritici]|uniref:Uncharacterized protein n=1 Tax=Puccinia graminis f. sp. tritici TaxID=56615 RepID=A0A5B0RNH0_PUCGR|nr:hypothetical protein PGTUg99_037321 [Puccinia graminis f. sp. tritici]
MPCVHPPSPLISRCSRYSQRIRYLSAFAILGVHPPSPLISRCSRYSQRIRYLRCCSLS